MNDSRKLYRAFTFVTLGLTAITLAVRTAILCFTFDYTLGYHAGGILSTLLYILFDLGDHARGVFGKSEVIGVKSAVPEKFGRLRHKGSAVDDAEAVF